MMTVDKTDSEICLPVVSSGSDGATYDQKKTTTANPHKQCRKCGLESFEKMLLFDTNNIPSLMRKCFAFSFFQMCVFEYIHT